MSRNRRIRSAVLLLGLLLAISLVDSAFAQRRVRYDQQHLKNSPAILEAVSPFAAAVAQGTVRVLVGEEPVALGTVISEDGCILTKASELQDGFLVELPDARRLPGTVVGVLKDHDLAAIRVEATGLTPVRFSAQAVNSAAAGQWRTTPAGSIRSGDWKLLEFFEDGRRELYNLGDDVGEKTNLASAMPEKVEALHAQLVAWRKQVAAKMPTKNDQRSEAKAESSRKRERARQRRAAGGQEE